MPSLNSINPKTFARTLSDTLNVPDSRDVLIENPTQEVPVDQSFAFLQSNWDAFDTKHGMFAIPELSDKIPFSNEELRKSIIHVWEGRVLQVDKESQLMEVLLISDTGSMPDHVAKMSLEWVAEQDKGLVAPGASFYLIMYKTTTKRTIKNSQELHFRRLSRWSQSQINQISFDAEQLLARFSKKDPPTNEEF